MKGGFQMNIKKPLIPPVLGLLVFAIYLLVDRFITPLPDWIPIPVVLIELALVVLGVFKFKK